MKLSRYSLHVLLCLLVAGFISSCKQNPKELGTFPVKTNSAATDNNNIVTDVHQIRIQEAHPSTKYLYLLVEEGDRSYWVATGPTEVEVGDTYYYNE
ncbi:MAG: hypothetical protein R3356_08185, partial [Eudoraea sp.]|nr:hypothetical protein [Eudoraea sp.]